VAHSYYQSDFEAWSLCDLNRKYLEYFLAFHLECYQILVLGVHMLRNSTLSADQIHLVYQGLLGRPPENDLIVQQWLGKGANLSAIIQDIVKSQEFQNRRDESDDDGIYGPRAKVDIAVGEDEYDRMVARIVGQWVKLGENDPHWSVLTAPEYRKSVLDTAAIADFYATGKGEVDSLEDFCVANNVPPPSGTCFELGCGVGRVTYHLAQGFDTVIAADISPGNLAEAKHYIGRQGDIENIDFRLLTSPRDIEGITEFDCFYSIIVLQHNPPPMQHAFLKHILGSLNSGGIFFFQTQAALKGYSFDIASYLTESVKDLDMHCLPMNDILGLVADTGCMVRDIQPDHRTDMTGSYTFFGIKP
jgi:SAM-dependent methyltransferase